MGSDNMSILYGSGLIRDWTIPTVKPTDPVEWESALNQGLQSDDYIARLIRQRGEKAYIDGDMELAIECRKLWLRLTGEK